jgi:hypothetical protein
LSDELSPSAIDLTALEVCAWSQLGLFNGDSFDGHPSEEELEGVEEWVPPRFDPAEVLALVNSAREARGLPRLERLEFRGARRRDPDRCVLARALECTVQADHVIFESWLEAAELGDALGWHYDGNWVELPDQLRRFGLRFDRGSLRADEFRVDRPGQLALDEP